MEHNSVLETNFSAFKNSTVPLTTATVERDSISLRSNTIRFYRNSCRQVIWQESSDAQILSSIFG